MKKEKLLEMLDELEKISITQRDIQNKWLKMGDKDSRYFYDLEVGKLQLIAEIRRRIEKVK